ncbi:hypothetical protein BDN71DRAFT_1509572 [Pleurotus eryngii]|uniref:Secreted protein n=1 Tax=Pleurotus eryngii TaxID=5323 RepID=A0A9P5ZQX9_PLEER|nr:hypothetical protein BDN71DRAFT_1509572 [Pleurotus eryngii]
MLQTVWLSILCVLWLLTPSTIEALAPDGCDALAGHGRNVCGQLPFIELYCYIISAARMCPFYRLPALFFGTWEYPTFGVRWRQPRFSPYFLIYSRTLSVLATKAVVDGHPDVWMASAWDLPYTKNQAYTNDQRKDHSTEALLYENV